MPNCLCERHRLKNTCERLSITAPCGGLKDSGTAIAHLTRILDDMMLVFAGVAMVLPRMLH